MIGDNLVTYGYLLVYFVYLTLWCEIKIDGENNAESLTVVEGVKDDLFACSRQGNATCTCFVYFGSIVNSTTTQNNRHFVRHDWNSWQFCTLTSPRFSSQNSKVQISQNKLSLLQQLPPASCNDLPAAASGGGLNCKEVERSAQCAWQHPRL